MVKTFFSNVYKESSRITRIVYTRQIKDFALISIGVIMATIGLKEFLLPNHFLDGGAMGVSLLLNKMFGNIELSTFNKRHKRWHD